MFSFLRFALLLGALPVLCKTEQADKLSLFLQREQQRNFAELKKLDSLQPYFIAYRVHDTDVVEFSANKGGVVRDSRHSSRAFGAEVRVGGSAFDNTHPIRENLDFVQWSGYQNVPWPLEGNEAYWRKSLRIATDYAYRSARDQFSKIRANVGVRPDAGDTGLDFANTVPVRSTMAPAAVLPARKALDSLYARILRASALFSSDPQIYSSQIDFNYGTVLRRFISTEGALIAEREMRGSIAIYVETKAEDGMILWLYKDFSFRDAPLDFSADTLSAAVRLLMARLDTLRKAPVMETYAGPVILENQAAGVFVHEVFGHRVEGHRQKAVDEGQTFVSKVGQRIANPQISIVDDPSLETFGKQALNGFYRFDDEGVPGQRALLMENGTFKGFLLGRSVVSARGGANGASNGHGRANLGLPVVARMGNTLLSATHGQSFAILRDSLKSLLRQQGKPFGLILHDISGGFTYTTRDVPQSFRVEPLYATRVFADGQPDEVVRGVDAVGTPLASLSQIVAAGDDPAVFNGHCGAESGWIPVSAISPSLLLRSMEFETRAKDQNLPPLLAPPRRAP
jgi:predicted Zn-dependent protease